MAGDLIPPPSPAGRPEPDSSDKRDRDRGRHRDGGAPSPGSLWSGGEQEGSRMRPAVALAAADPAAASDAARAEAAAVAGAPAVPSPYRSRFGLVLGGLIGVALATAGIALLLALNAPDDGVPDGWSAWKPTAADELGAARQIAAHVAPHYRLGDGDQLVAVQAGGLEIGDIPLSVALRTAADGGDIELLEGNGVMYTLNGLGPRGSITGGEPSPARHLLLRREALELALYTFRYAADVDMVVALLPPPPPEKGADPASVAQTPTQAMFFRPGDLENELRVPLTATIPARTPRPEKFRMTSGEGRRIDALTSSHLFLASFTQGQDSRAFLVLNRPPG